MDRHIFIFGLSGLLWVWRHSWITQCAVLHCTLPFACMCRVVVRGPLATGRCFLCHSASAPSCDTRSVFEDPTSYLCLRHAGLPFRCLSSPRLAGAHHLGNSNNGPGCSPQARRAGFGRDVRRRIHCLSKQNVVLVQASACTWQVANANHRVTKPISSC